MCLEKQNQIYHGCWLCYEDGTRCLIQTQMGKKCLIPTFNPFWKLPEHVDSKVETMTQEASKKITIKRYILNYCKNLLKNQN